MAQFKEHSLKEFQLRAKLPQYFRYGAIVVLGVTILAVIVGFYREGGKPPFRLIGGPTRLSADVVAEVSNYDRMETEGGVPKYYIKADNAKTFADNHQELQNVYIRTYDDQGAEADTMTSQKAIYVPEENKAFTAYLNGDVHINSRDGLKVITNNVVYSKKNEVADADEAVAFERENIKGTSVGATVKLGEKKIELLKDVSIGTFDSPDAAKSAVRYAKVTAGSASYDQTTNKIEMNTDVVIKTVSRDANPKNTDVRADRAVLYLYGESDAKKPENAGLKKFELFDNVHIVSTQNGVSPTNIDAGYAMYDKAADRYDLKNGAHIVIAANSQPTDIKADEAAYDQTTLKVGLNGNAEITQAGDYVKGDVIAADLYEDKKLHLAQIRGNGLVRQTTESRTTSVTAPEINAAWGDTRLLQSANTTGDSVARLQPNGSADYSLVTLSAPRAIHMAFATGLLASMTTDGRTTIQLDAVAADANSANKRVTADTVKTYFYDNGKDIRRAEAVGDAELYIEPLKASTENYQTTINAPRFDCDFYATGNSARLCVGGKKTKTVRVPTVAVEGRGNQTLNADTVTAAFNEKTKDIEHLDAAGNAKFTELERSAISNTMTFTQADSTVRLRGGEPTAFDAASRAKANEIDWDTKAKRSYLRGHVSTTYYSRSKMGDAAPFATSDKPVFITSDTAEFDHTTSVSLFSGNARGWQDSNYVRGDRLVIHQTEGKMTADGNVQSVLYDAKQKTGGKGSNVPVYAASRSLAYDKNTRLLQYIGDADIRQGTDRLTAAKADVYLSEKNEVSRTIATTNVVLTQPGRRATGDWVQYTADNELAILRGAPANVSDAENGDSQAAEISFNMRDHHVASESKAKPNGTGRLRNVYKVKPAQ